MRVTINIFGDCHHKPDPATGLQLWYRAAKDQTIRLKGENMVLISDLQKFGVSITPVDAKGNKATVDGVPAWNSSDPALLTVTPSADGLSATVTAVGPTGTAQVSVTADADLGPGVATISGTLDVQIEASAAVSLTIATEAPTAQ